LSGDELHGLLLTSTGAKIDGSWRNAIGEEAEKVMQRLLVKEARERSLLSALIRRAATGLDRNSATVEAVDVARVDEQIGHIELYRGIILANQTSILFSSEPDISLITTDGRTSGVVEVKGGADPAGALERYGAAKKSFEDTRRSSPAAKTILVASCITREVHERIQNDPTITSYYNLTQLLDEGDAERYQRFMDEVFALLI
jgi:hypothetical protein